MPGPVFLEGSTVDLRTIEEEDLEFMQEAVNQRNVWRGIGMPHPVNMHQQQDYFENHVSDDDHVNLLITIGPETPVGTISFTRIDREANWGELGYWIHPDHQGNGYGTEAAEILIEYGFNQRGFHRIQARVTEFNDPSRGLLESLGFTLEGVQRECSYVDGQYQDTLWFSLLEDEWDGSPKS